MLEIRELCCGYGHHEVLREVSFTAKPGEITTIIGCNGCGKSTLLKTIVRLVPIRHGEIRIDNQDLSEYSSFTLARKTAYLAQGRGGADIRVKKMVLHGRFPYLSYPRHYRQEDWQIATEAMEQMGIRELADSMMSELSGGTRQKVYIAMALAQKAQILLMDEPTTYLDISQQMKLAKTVQQLKESGKTVVLVLHDLLLALQLSDKIVLLDQGTVRFCGNAKELLALGLIEEVLGVSIGTFTQGNQLHYFYQMK